MQWGRILKIPDVVERLAAQGAIVPDSMTQAQVSAFVRDDVVMWRKLIEEAAIQAEQECAMAAGLAR